MSLLFKQLDEAEQAKARQWARDNYRKFSPINGIWHPIVREECAKINAETESSPRMD